MRSPCARYSRTLSSRDNSTDNVHVGVSSSISQFFTHDHPFDNFQIMTNHSNIFFCSNNWLTRTSKHIISLLTIPCTLYHPGSRYYPSYLLPLLPRDYSVNSSTTSSTTTFSTTSSTTTSSRSVRIAFACALMPVCYSQYPPPLPPPHLPWSLPIAFACSYACVLLSVSDTAWCFSLFLLLTIHLHFLVQ